MNKITMNTLTIGWEDTTIYTGRPTTKLITWSRNAITSSRVYRYRTSDTTFIELITIQTLEKVVV